MYNFQLYHLVCPELEVETNNKKKKQVKSESYLIMGLHTVCHVIIYMVWFKCFASANNCWKLKSVISGKLRSDNYLAFCLPGFLTLFLHSCPWFK